MRLLLASTSRLYGQVYLEYLMDELREFFLSADSIVFVPYARPGGMDWDEYTEIARRGFKAIKIEVVGIHQLSNPAQQLKEHGGIFTGGGNTFVLLKTLYDTGHFDIIKTAVFKGMPYMGSSAGTNVAGLSIGATNDMPIVYPIAFEAFRFVPFNINPHYMDPDPTSTHMGETREQRIAEFHYFNPQPVVGLREGSWLRIQGDSVELRGALSARIFRRGLPAEEIPPGPLLL